MSTLPETVLLHSTSITPAGQRLEANARTSAMSGHALLILRATCRISCEWPDAARNWNLSLPSPLPRG